MLGVQSCLTFGVTLLDGLPCCPPSLPTLTRLPRMPIFCRKLPVKFRKASMITDESEHNQRSDNWAMQQQPLR
jgi:hypothetical protein